MAVIHDGAGGGYSRPYEAPDSLDDLAGPRSGFLRLPIGVFWQAGDKRVDLSRRGDLVLAYQEILANGTAEQQCKYLDKGLLISLWPHLNVPVQVARGWEGLFPELSGNPRGSW